MSAASTPPNPVADKTVWENLVQHYPEANFLQSWNWGVFHEQLGHPVTRLVWEENSRPVAVASAVKETAKRGTYLTIAGGPLLDWSQPAVVSRVMTDLRSLGQAERVDFIRFRPQVVNSPTVAAVLNEVGAKPSPMHVTADITVTVDLSKSLDELMASFRKSTRYEVRRAEKEGITVRRSTDPADIDLMYQDQLALAKKHNFVPFSHQFWAKQFAAFAADDQVELFHAELNGERLASAFILYYNQEAVYHYGTSTAANGKLPGSYACQWAVIQRAKERGCQRYNLWGIAPPNQPNHRFAGVTTFKTGFSEQVTEFVPAHDLPISWKYQPINWFESLRRKARKL